MSAGCLCRLDKQNTVAACFTPLPLLCQAVSRRRKKGLGSNTPGSFDTVVHFQLVCSVCFPGKTEDESLTILFAFATSPSPQCAEEAVS